MSIELLKSLSAVHTLAMEGAAEGALERMLWLLIAVLIGQAVIGTVAMIRMYTRFKVLTEETFPAFRAGVHEDLGKLSASVEQVRVDLARVQTGEARTGEWQRFVEAKIVDLDGRLRELEKR